MVVIYQQAFRDKIKSGLVGVQLVLPLPLPRVKGTTYPYIRFTLSE
jgi:hypothetical protein